MKAENFKPQDMEDILAGYQKIMHQREKAKILYQKNPTGKNKKYYQECQEEWLKFREEYKAVLQASVVKSRK